jgi:hypothetical protein
MSDSRRQIGLTISAIADKKLFSLVTASNAKIACLLVMGARQVGE